MLQLTQDSRRAVDVVPLVRLLEQFVFVLLVVTSEVSAHLFFMCLVVFLARSRIARAHHLSLHLSRCRSRGSIFVAMVIIVTPW